MIAFESQRSRRVLLRLDAPDRLRSAVADIAQTHAIGTAWVRGAGTVAWIELTRWDERSRGWGDARRYEHAELLSLEGHLALKEGTPHLTARGSVRLHANGAVVGGAVTDLGALAVELMFDVFDDLLLTLERDEATGLARWRSETTTPELDKTPAPEAPTDGVSWAVVASASALRATDEGRVNPRTSGDLSTAERSQRLAARKKRKEIDPQHLRGYDPDGRRAGRAARKQRRAEPTSLEPGFVPPPLPSKRRTSEDEFFDEPIPERGDWVDHKVFGLCRVDGEDAEGGLLIRLPSGVRKAIRLDYFDVLEPRIEDEKIIYPLRPRPRG